MAKRRPGRDPEMQPATAEVTEEVRVVEVVTETPSSSTESSQHSEAAFDSSASSSREESAPKIEINFKGSEILRAKFPTPFQVAEQIATDWVHGGRFEGLPLGHPLAQYFAAKGLRKAKEVEKQVLESPVTEKIALQALTAGMKAQEIINQVRSKVKK